MRRQGVGEDSHAPRRMSGDLEEELKQAREQGQLQAARSEVTTLQECVERQRQQLEALQKALDAAKAESKTQQAEVERLTRELEGLRHESSSAATGGSAQR